MSTGTRLISLHHVKLGLLNKVFIITRVREIFKNTPIPYNCKTPENLKFSKSIKKKLLKWLMEA